MGAGASVKILYKEAIAWFRNYIDSETYHKDFESMDKDNDGGLSFMELKSWIDKKISSDTDGKSGWFIFKSNMNLLKIAHKNASESGDSTSTAYASKVVDVTEFKTLLLHLFVISILWTHFQNADNWDLSGNSGYQQLDFEQFKLACHTMSASRGQQETLSDEQLTEDFDLIDTNKNGKLGFIEVCNYCCKFLYQETLFDGNGSDSKAQKVLGSNLAHETNDIAVDLSKGHKQYFESLTTDDKGNNAISQLKDKIDTEIKRMEISTKEHLSKPLDSDVNISESDILVNENKPEIIESVKENDEIVIGI